MDSAQYCQNYYTIHFDGLDWNPFENLTKTEAKLIKKHHYGEVKPFQRQTISKPDLSNFNFNFIKTLSHSNTQLDEDMDFDASNLIDLKDILFEKNIRVNESNR